MTAVGEVGPNGLDAPRPVAGEPRAGHGKKPQLRPMEGNVKDQSLNLWLATQKTVVSCIQNSQGL